MSLFGKKDEHAGSGLDKPDPKSLKEKLTDVIKTVVPASDAPKADPVQTLPPAD